VAEDIIQFQTGREARIDNEKRDQRRSSDWLEGWEQVDMDCKRKTLHSSVETGIIST